MASQRNWASLTAYATIVRGERVSPTVHDHYPLQASVWLGIAQIVCSLAVTVTCIVGFGFYGILFTLGLQFPLMAVIAGSFGIGAGVTKTSCKIGTNLTLSVLCAINSCGLVVLAVWFLGIASTLKGSHYPSGSMNYEIIERSTGIVIALLVLSLIESIVAIASAIVGCHFLCLCCRKCCCQFDNTTTDQIILRQSDDVEALLPANGIAPRNDGDVPMLHVAGAMATASPYVGSHFSVPSTSYVQLPK